MNEQHHQWTIDAITDTFIYDPVRGGVPAKRVEFTTQHGHKSAIDVPLSEFVPDHVAAMVQAQHDAIHNVMQMHGPPVPP